MPWAILNSFRTRYTLDPIYDRVQHSCHFDQSLILVPISNNLNTDRCVLVLLWAGICESMCQLELKENLEVILTETVQLLII
jgi:hypothetical protein